MATKKRDGLIKNASKFVELHEARKEFLGDFKQTVADFAKRAESLGYKDVVRDVGTTFEKKLDIEIQEEDVELKKAEFELHEATKNYTKIALKIADSLEERIGDSIKVTVPDAKHHSHLDNPKFFNETLESFIQDYWVYHRFD